MKRPMMCKNPEKHRINAFLTLCLIIFGTNTNALRALDCSIASSQKGLVKSVIYPAGQNPESPNEAILIRVESNGFNAKKRSGFTVSGLSESTTRGLTVIHFYTSRKYEFRSFDTHGSATEAAGFIEALKILLKNKATFVIMAHDSAAGSLSPFSGELSKLGFKVLSQLQSRQAYLMDNFTGSISESVNDLSLHAELTVPAGLNEIGNVFPKTKYEYTPSNDRFIAHAAGEINGIKSTNSKEALDENYKKGFRLFELDIITTSDGQYVAAHDWKMWSRFTDYSGELPVKHAEFLQHKIYGKYTTLDMKGINKWFAAHPDAVLITDKVSNPLKFANQFIDKSRLVMELFSLMAVEEATKNGIAAMISQEPLNSIAGDKLTYLKANKIGHVAISRRIVARSASLLETLGKNGIKVYVYNVNFDPGKDEQYVLDNEIGLVYGMYADKWVFDKEGIQP